MNTYKLQTIICLFDEKGGIGRFSVMPIISDDMKGIIGTLLVSEKSLYNTCFESQDYDEDRCVDLNIIVKRIKTFLNDKKGWTNTEALDWLKDCISKAEREFGYSYQFKDVYLYIDDKETVINHLNNSTGLSAIEALKSGLEWFSYNDKCIYFDTMEAWVSFNSQNVKEKITC